MGDETLTFEAGNGINVSQNGGKITITNTGSGAGGSGNTHYYSVQSAQTAAGSNYNNDGATGNNSMAMGPFAKANARNDIAIGHQAGALSGEGPISGGNGERVTIGSNATVGSNQAISVNAGGSLGTVNLAVKSVGQSVAIGGGTGAQPENRTYAYGDQSLAIGSDTLAYGDSSVAIGGDDLNRAGSQQISYTDPTNGNQVNGTVRQAYQALTGDTMQNGVYIKTASKQAGVSVGVQAQSGDLGVALGAKSTASGTASTAIGTGASANKDNAIALGAGSKTNTNATQVTSATVGGLTYGNFAGNSSIAVGDQVSVGNTGFERQIKHVAPGEISAASTDAINGSQLYATQKTLGNVGNTVKTILGGNAAIDADGNITMSNIGGTGQNTIHDAIQAAKTKVQAADNSPVTVTGTGSSTDPYKVGVNTVTLAPATGTDAGKVAAPATGDAGKLVTAGDIANAINSSGFKATAGGNTTGAAPTEELIKAGDTLTLKAGSGLTVEQTGSSFTYALNAQQVVQDAQTPVVYTKADGSKVYKHTDGNFYDQPNGAGTQVAAGDVIASMQGADGVTTATPATKDADGIMTMAGGTTLNNVASAGDITNPANAYRAVNAGDLNNSVQKLVNNGFKIDADNGTADTVKLGETVKYAGDGNITTTVSNNQIGFKLANTVTIGSGTGSNPVKIDGTTGNVTGLTNITWDPANTPITSGRAATEDQLLAVANAANSAGAGFTIAGNSKAAGVTTADETIKAGETLSIKGTGTGAFTDYDSSNIQTQVGANGEVTVGLKKDLNVNSITAGNTKVDNGGITINNPADPSKNVSLTGNGLNNGGNTITNVGDGVADTDAVNVRQLKAAQTNVNNLTNNVIGTDKPNITTYDVHGNVADNQNTVVEAINNMNTGGIKFFHVNDGTGSQNTAGTLSHPEDSSAKGNYGAAVGYQAKADGESSVAFGKGAQATGKNTIAIGTGNVVTGEGSGAIGDPTTITGRGTYSVGNNNGTISANEAGVFGNNNTLTGDSSRIIGNSSTVTTTDTFVMGNNSTSNVANSVVLGSNAAATSAATASSAGTTTYASSVINGTTYNYAGATPTGVVSVGNVGAERRVQNVAAGLISADSTDAINGSQLYATNSAINALQTGAAGIVQYSNGNAQPNGGTPTNHVTMVGADQNAPVTVHNVAAGVAPTDAVNVSQLQGVAGQIGKVADEADAGTAAAMAAAGLPQAYLPGKSMVAVSGSTYRGKQGYAVGFSAINDGGNWIVKGIATGNSKGKFGATIGAGYQW